MGLNLSNQQIGQELDLNKDDVQQMAAQLRIGIVAKKPKVRLTGEVECDEMYLIAGHKGQPEVVKAKGRKGGRRQLKAKAGRGTLAKEKPPIFAWDSTLWGSSHSDADQCQAGNDCTFD